MQSLHQKGLRHRRRRSDTDLLTQQHRIAVLMEHYHALCALMNKQTFYDTYTQYEEKVLLSSLPVDLITADILDIKFDHVKKLDYALSQQPHFESDRLHLAYLLYWWALNAETLSTEVPFIYAQVEAVFNAVAQERQLWNAIENHLENMQGLPNVDASAEYDYLLQSLAHFHQTLGELFNCKRSHYFIELIGSVRRAYAYWNIPVHPAANLVSALKVYGHSSQRIIDLASKLQGLHTDQAFSSPACSTAIMNAIVNNTQKMHTFQCARADILSYIQDLARFWRLSFLSLNGRCVDLPLAVPSKQADDILFLQVSMWLLKREKRQQDNQGMPLIVLEEAMVDDYAQLQDAMIALIQNRASLCADAATIMQHIRTIYYSSFDAVDRTPDNSLIKAHIV